MRFGLFGGTIGRKGGAEADHAAYHGYVDYVREAEALGYHSLYLVEHHFAGTGQISSSLNLLTYLAGVTRRIRLGTAVVVLPWHNPVLLAEQVAILDQLSNGRVELGVGRGYRPHEAAGFSIPQDELQPRFEECLEILQKVWSEEERFSHDGRFWHFADGTVEPRPFQKPHPPIWMAAGSPDSIRRAARRGFKLLLDQFGSIELTGERVAIYRDAVEAEGRVFDPSSVAVTRSLHFADDDLQRDQAYAQRGLTMKAIGRFPNSDLDEAPREALEASGLVGTSSEVAEQVQRLDNAGVANVLLIDVTVSKETLRRFSSEVMARFSEDMRS